MPLLGTYLAPMWITTRFLYTFTMTPRCEFITGTWEIVRLSKSTVHCIIMFVRRNISAKSIMQLRVLSFWTFLIERWRHYWDLLVCFTILISCFALFVPFVTSDLAGKEGTRRRVHVTWIAALASHLDFPQPGTYVTAIWRPFSLCVCRFPGGLRQPLCK